MNKALKIFTVITMCLAPSAFALKTDWRSGLIEVKEGRKLHVEHRRAAAGKQTLFMLNGLTWSTRDWRSFVEALDEIDPGLGIVLYDMRGMGKTLLEYAPVRENITLEEQVNDLKALREHLNIDGATAMVGLSYGGAVALTYAAKFAQDFDQIIAMAPFIERLTDQDQMIDRWVQLHRMRYPFDPRSPEELYDHYLRVLIYTTYPFAEPVLLENPYKLEATFRMVQGADDFKAADLAHLLPKGKIHLIGAQSDKFVKPERLDIFWESIKSTGASFLKMKFTEHKIASEQPEMSAHWVYHILNGHPAIRDGAIFEANPIRGQAVSGDIAIPLKKAGYCDLILRAARRVL